MKTKSILSLLFAALCLTSCNSFLDKLPDDRTEIDSKQKVIDLLVSAYGTRDNCLVHKYMSDDVMYNGASYTCNQNIEQLWRFEDVTTEGNDDPRSLWDNYYNAVAVANTALEAIESLGDSDGDLNGVKSEALLCRAFAMYRLAAVFCMAYDPTKEYLGLPYPTQVGVETIDRGTLTELYDKINADIEAALAIFDDSHTGNSKYRFTRKAAYCFAARFNLMYHNWDKAIEYANEVIGSNPFNVLRDWSQYDLLGAADTRVAFAQSGDPANLFLHTAYSLAGRQAYGSGAARYNHSTNTASYETIWANAPWGSGSGVGSALWLKKEWGQSYACSFYRVGEFFEYTDKVGGTGYAHIVMSEFTGDEAVLTRAEAYIMKGEYLKAVDDMNSWMQAACDQRSSRFLTFTVENIPEIMNGYTVSAVVPGSDRDRTIKKALNPQGFTITEEQTPYLQLLLHMRRIADLFTSRRMVDIKRYGIEYTHPTPDNPRPTEEDKEVFRAGDLRGAIQIPNDPLNAGIAANPR